jgi:hypothetical protein
MVLSNSERQARHRDKRDAEIEALHNALTKACKEIEHLRAVDVPPSDSAALSEARKETERLRRENVAQRAYYEEMLARRAARKAKTAAADQAAAEKYADDDRVTLLEKLVQADKQLAASKSRIKNLDAEIVWFRRERQKIMTPSRMSRQLHRQVLGWLHPDRAHNDEEQRRKLNKVFQEFSAIEFTFPNREPPVT